MRQQLANMKPAAVQQCRERWQKRAEEVQRFQDKKGGGASPLQKIKHRVMRSLDRNSKEDEKSLEKWTNELRAKAEAEEIKKMKQEDVRSRKALQQCQNLSNRLKVNESADLTICEFASWYLGDKHSNVLSDLKHLRNHEYGWATTNGCGGLDRKGSDDAGEESGAAAGKDQPRVTGFVAGFAYQMTADANNEFETFNAYA